MDQHDIPFLGDFYTKKEVQIMKKSMVRKEMVPVIEFKQEGNIQILKI